MEYHSPRDLPDPHNVDTDEWEPPLDLFDQLDVETLTNGKIRVTNRFEELTVDSSLMVETENYL